jgi:distribution and morphology protein 34
MAFNFNWSPLMADSEFYSRAKELLTTALNKSPKPPIIVDDILVNELNLGSVPPELEILEIGDLAEDRFRGIFKMCYSGDAFLTLKTRVQANPLNTYLSRKPSFTSPQPLAASSGLTIPLQITLSDFKLSAFIILVFSKQKGLTLVFRNDPLESMTVSSTFDSIPFVRDYLQKEIEGQLRVLLMDEVPAIIHRLSLRLWVKDHPGQQMNKLAESIKLVDPLATPPQDALGLENDPSFLSLDLDSGDEAASFSQKNLSRLAALQDANHTLALSPLPIREAVLRAWAGFAEKSNGSNGSPQNPLASPSLDKESAPSTTSVYSFTEATDSENNLRKRPTLYSFGSSTGLSLGAGRHRAAHSKKKKKRVINLRQSRSVEGSIADTESVSDRSAYSEQPMSWQSTPWEHPAPIVPPSINEEDELSSPLRGSGISTKAKDVTAHPTPVKNARPATPRSKDVEKVAEAAATGEMATQTTPKATPQPRSSPRPRPVPVQRQSGGNILYNRPLSSYFADKQSQSLGGPLSASSSNINLASLSSQPSFGSLDHLHASRSSTSLNTAANRLSGMSSRAHAGSPPPLASPGAILEQAYMFKVASEIAQRLDEKEQQRQHDQRNDRHHHQRQQQQQQYQAAASSSSSGNAGFGKNVGGPHDMGEEQYEEAPPAYGVQ